MKSTMHKAALLGSAILAAAAPIDNEKRQLSSLGGLGGSASGSPSFGGGDLPFSLPSGGEDGSLSGIFPPGGSIPTGGSELPFSLPAGGSGGLPTGLPFSLPAGGEGSLPTGFPSGSEGGVGGGSFPIPSGLAGLQGSGSPLAGLGGGSSFGSGSSPLAGLGSAGGLSGTGLGLEGTNFPSTTLTVRQAEDCDESADAPSSPSSPAAPASPTETVFEAVAPTASSYTDASSSGSGSGFSIPSGSGLGSLGGAGSSLGGLSGLGSGSSVLSGLSGLGSGSSGLAGLSGLGGGSSTGLGVLSGLQGGSGLSGLGSGTGGFGGLSGSSGLGSLGSLGSLGGGLGGLTGSASGLEGLGGGTGASSAEPPTPSSTAAPSDSGSGSSSGGGYSDASASSYSGGGTASDVTDNTGCRAMTFIFARGTGEFGNMGTVVGPPTASALQELLGANGVSVQGVDYPASAAGNANLGGAGGPEMANLAQQALSACPDTKIVLGGYSQGAMVVHNALRTFSGSNVAAVVAFGDPFNGQAFDGVDDSKVLEVCGSSDFLCSSGGTNVSGGHISYSDDGAQAAQFAVQAAGL